MINENWQRWAWASFSKHFADYFTAKGIHCFVDGDDRQTSELTDFVEFRMDGLKIRELNTPNYYRLYIPVNVLIKSTMNGETTHRHPQLIGTTSAAFAKTIDIMKFGNGAEDDQSFLVCMTLMQDRLNELRVNNFGQVDETVRVQQATVEGHYEGFLKT